MICRLTLKKIESGLFDKNAAKAFFGNSKPVESLGLSRSDFFSAGTVFSEGLSISGVQQKLSLEINENNEFEIVSTGGTYILKPSPESFPNAAENEQCAMCISRCVGIDTALSANLQFIDGEEAYITKRYDRLNGTKLHQEDLAQGFNLLSKDKYSKSYEEALLLVREMTGGKLSVVKDLFNRIVLAYIIGNNDMHLKNISLIKNADNNTRFYDGLTPNYDQLLVQALSDSPQGEFLALNFFKQEEEGVFSSSYEKYGFYTGSDFYILGKKTGLRPQVVKSILEHYFHKEGEILKIVKNSFMPEHMKNRAESIISERILALKK
jgi:serine/threonine-protein kinase HipA